MCREVPSPSEMAWVRFGSHQIEALPERNETIHQALRPLEVDVVVAGAVD
jgi:hypothetical protein